MLLLLPMWAAAVVATAVLIATASNEFSAFQLGACLIAACCVVTAAAFSTVYPEMMIVSMYLIVIFMFHFGLAVAFLSHSDVFTIFRGSYFWYDRQADVIRAYIASTLFMLGLTSAAIMTLRTRGASKATRTTAIDRVLGRRSYMLSLALLFGVEVLWVLEIIFIHRVTNYDAYNAVFRDSSNLFGVVLIYLYPTIAALFFFAAAWSKDSRPAFLVYFLWAIFAFPIGMRGEVLFPVAMTVSVLHVQGRLRLRWLQVAVGSYLLLLLSFFDRLFRSEVGFHDAIAGASGMYGLAELGNSLRPVAEVAAWLTGGVDHLRWGETYIAPFERTLQRLLPFTDPIPAALDDRLMNSLLQARTGGSYGFSIVAESLINFGYLGCLVLGAGTGFFLAKYGRSVSAGRIGVFASAAVYALYYHVRQSFVGSYGSFLIFSAVGLTVIFVARGGAFGIGADSPNRRQLPERPRHAQ